MRCLFLFPMVLWMGCTGWYGRTTVAELDAPAAVQVTQDWKRYLWFSGTKVIFLPYIGCSTRVAIVDADHSFLLDEYEGRVVLPFIQGCPGEMTGPLLASPDGGYLAFQQRDRWHVVQRTKAGLFRVAVPEDFQGDAPTWDALSDGREDPAARAPLA
jgi:hypothetical protein